MSSCRMKRVSLVLAFVLSVSLFPIPPAHAGEVSWLRGLEKATHLFEGTSFLAKLLEAISRSGGGMDPNGGRNPGSAPPPPPPGNHH